eukprot:gene1741-2082_t
MQPTYWHRFPDIGVAAACGAVVKVWDPSEPDKGIKLFEGTSVYTVSFSPNNKVLAVGGDKCQVSLYSSTPQPGGDRMVAQLPTVPGLRWKPLQREGQQMPPVHHLALSRLDPQLLAGGNAAGQVLLWDLNHGHQTAQSSAVDVHKGAITGLACSDADPHLMITCGADGRCKGWDRRTSKIAWSVANQQPLTCLAVRHDGQLVAVGTAAGAVLVQDPGTGDSGGVPPPFMITPGIELPAGLSTALTPPLLAEVARGKEVTPGSSRLQTAPPAGRQPGAAGSSSTAPGTEEVGAPLSRQQRPAGRTGAGSSNRSVGSGKAGRGSLNEAPEFGGAGDTSSRPGSTAGAVASADGGLRAGAGSSGPQSATSEVAAPALLGGGGLREDVFKAYLDQQMAELSQQMKSMHLDMLRQFHQAQMDLVSVVDGLVQRQDQLAEAVAELSAVVAQQGVGAKGHLQRQLHPGTIGLLPWV